MNERIRELAEQAISDVDYIRDDDFTNEELSQMYIPDCFAEKFAELIVRECAELFVDQRYMILNPHEPFANERVRALKEHDKYTVKKIKQHFGVEEQQKVASKPKCSVCGTTENVKYMGGHQPYLCDSVDCIPF